MGVKWKLVSVRLEIVLVLVQDRCTVCAKQGLESFQKHTMELLGDEAQMESCFGPFVDSVSISARLAHGLFQTRLGNRFDRTRWNS